MSREANLGGQGSVGAGLSRIQLNGGESSIGFLHQLTNVITKTDQICNIFTNFTRNECGRVLAIVCIPGQLGYIFINHFLKIDDGVKNIQQFIIDKSVETWNKIQQIRGNEDIARNLIIILQAATHANNIEEAARLRSKWWIYCFLFLSNKMQIDGEINGVNEQIFTLKKTFYNHELKVGAVALFTPILLPFLSDFIKKDFLIFIGVTWYVGCAWGFVKNHRKNQSIMDSFSQHYWNRSMIKSVDESHTRNAEMFNKVMQHRG